MQNLELLTLKFSELCSIHNLVQNTVGLGGRWEYHTEKSEGRWCVRFCMVVQVDLAPLQINPLYTPVEILLGVANQLHPS